MGSGWVVGHSAPKAAFFKLILLTQPRNARSIRLLVYFHAVKHKKPSRNGNSASAGPTLPMPDSNRIGKQQRVNTSIQNPKSHCVIPPSNDLSKKKGNSPALRKPLTAFTAVLWLAGFILLLFGTPLARAELLPKNFWVNSTLQTCTSLD